VSGTPRSILGYAGPISGDMVTLGFKQSIGANDALRTGVHPVHHDAVSALTPK
jgi:hypothetical protein